MFHWIMYYNIRNISGRNLLVDYPIFCSVLMYMSVMYCDLHAWFSLSTLYKCPICTNSFNILALIYNGHIVINYTAHFVYSPLNSYVYIHLILDFKCVNVLRKQGLYHSVMSGIEGLLQNPNVVIL